LFCGREEGAKARMVINNTRPGYGLHHGHNIVLVTVSEVSAENLAMNINRGVAQTDTSRTLTFVTLSQALPALHASDTNSDAPYSFFGRGRELCVSKEKPPAVC